MNPLRIAVLVTCHNRREVTLASISRLLSAGRATPEVSLRIFVVDDGSSDGTAEALSALSASDLNIIEGTGRLFWAGGMRAAFQGAQAFGPFDAYLLFNDDVRINEDSFREAVSEYCELNLKQPSALAASTVGERGEVTYSAFRRLSWNPLKLARVYPTGTLERCDTFNGNFVLVPARAFEELGGLDPTYIHAYADLDLGFELQRLGVPSFLASRPIGQCDANPPSEARGVLRRVICGTWGKMDSPSQRSHFLSKNMGAIRASIFRPILVLRYWLHQLSQ